MTTLQKIKEIEDEMARTQKNKATSGHLGTLKVTHQTRKDERTQILHHRPSQSGTQILHDHRLFVSKPVGHAALLFLCHLTACHMKNIPGYNFPGCRPSSPNCEENCWNQAAAGAGAAREKDLR
jgi:hypothetical protein